VKQYSVRLAPQELAAFSALKAAGPSVEEGGPSEFIGRAIRHACTLMLTDGLLPCDSPIPRTHVAHVRVSPVTESMLELTASKIQLPVAVVIRTAFVNFEQFMWRLQVEQQYESLGLGSAAHHSDAFLALWNKYRHNHGDQNTVLRYYAQVENRLASLEERLNSPITHGMNNHTWMDGGFSRKTLLHMSLPNMRELARHRQIPLPGRATVKQIRQLLLAHFEHSQE